MCKPVVLWFGYLLQTLSHLFEYYTTLRTEALFVMESSSSSNATGIFIPNYPLAAGDLLRAIEHSGSVVSSSTDDDGEYYAMAMAQVLPAEQLPAESIIVIPLTTPRVDEALDFTFMAAAECMFVKIHETPQARRTYGHCAAYSVDCAYKPLAIGDVFKFSTLGTFVVARRQLVESVIASRGSDVDTVTETNVDKRQCIRPLVEVGELTDDTGGRLKGTSSYILDLNGVKHSTRNKTDIAQRERDLHMVFRAMDAEKMDYSITTDFVLQPEVYRAMLCEQGDSQADNRHLAFISCGLISRIHRLQVFRKTEKLKLLLIGSVLLEGSAEPTLTLDDFVTGEKIACRATTCPSNNSGLVSALKNLQTSLQIVFSDFFGTCLDIFIEQLEGAYRPMELVAADFLKYSVELTLRKFFRVIRSVKSSSIIGFSVEGPELCAQFMTNSFDKLASDLSSHASMVRQDAFFRLRMARMTDTSSASRAEQPSQKAEKQTVKFADTKTDGKVGPVATKVCSGHLGKQLGAVRKDGRLYACGYGKDCTFSHVTIENKTDQRLTEIVASMPSPIKQDLLKAIQSRK